MKPAGPSFRPRPGGGFNAGMGSFGEHLDENAMQQAVQQKALAQQSSSQTTTPTPQSNAHQHASPPREVGSLTEELFTRPAEDLYQGVRSIFDLNAWLGLDQKTPEQEQERARKEMILKRFNQLTEEQQAVARQMYEERLQRQRAEESEKEQKKQLEAQQEQQAVMAPSSPQKGPIGPGMSGKQKATAQLQWDRQRLNQPQGAG